MCIRLIGNCEWNSQWLQKSVKEKPFPFELAMTFQLDGSIQQSSLRHLFHSNHCPADRMPECFHQNFRRIEVDIEIPKKNFKVHELLPAISRPRISRTCYVRLIVYPKAIADIKHHLKFVIHNLVLLWTINKRSVEFIPNGTVVCGFVANFSAFHGTEYPTHCSKLMKHSLVIQIYNAMGKYKYFSVNIFNRGNDINIMPMGNICKTFYRFLFDA